MAYGYLRDATFRAALDPVHVHFRDRDEQVVRSHVNCATAAVGLGRHRYALHEFMYGLRSGKIGPSFFPIILERLSTTYRKLDQRDEAKAFAEKAIHADDVAPDHGYRGYVYTNRALLAHEDGDLEAAGNDFQTAFDAFRTQGNQPEAARCLSNLGQLYFDMKRYRAARRSMVAAVKMQPQNQKLQARAHILLGEIVEVEGRHEGARENWQKAATLAKDLKDKVLRFKGEFLLLRLALNEGDLAVARAIARRLRKLQHWIPQTTPELSEFAKLDQGRMSDSKRVAASQKG
jgi:tetratricopeptide (TPR) repeat protein